MQLADQLSKRVYAEGSAVLKEQANYAAPTFSKIKKSTKKISASGVFDAILRASNESGQSIDEAGTWTEPDGLTTPQPFVQPKRYVTPFELSVSAIELSETNAQSFAPNVDAMIKDAFRVGYSDLNRMSVGKGTGQITLANGAGAAVTTLIVDNAISFRQGMRIDSYFAGVLEISNAQITNVNYVTNTLTLATAQTWTDNTIIVRRGAGVPTASREIMGLQGICDTTAFSATFEGIASTGIWQGNVVPAGSVNISQDLLLRTYNRARAIGNGDPNFLISQYGQYRNFQSTELQKTRYADQEVKAGAIVVKWQNLTWMIDKDYDLNEVGLYDLENVERFETKDLHIANPDGKDMIRLSRQDAIGGYLRYEGNIGSWKRNAHARLTELTEPSL